MKTILALFVSTLFTFGAIGQLKLTEGDLVNLDREIALASQYDRQKYAVIDSLKSIFLDKIIPYNRRIKAGIELGKQYESFISDSSLVYYDKAMQLAEAGKDSLSFLTARIGKVKVLGVTGFYSEAVAELETLEKIAIPKSMNFLFFDCARQLYDYMLGYTQSSGTYSNIYHLKSRSYRDSLCTTLPQGSSLYKFYYAEVLQDRGKLSQSRSELFDILDSIPSNNALYARATSALAGLAIMDKDKETAAHYWAVSAISDIRGSIKENTSLQNLAVYLYSKGDFERAYKYICISLDDANFCNARLRNMQIAKNMPLINSAYKKEIDTKQDSLVFALSIVSVLSLGLIIAVVLILYQIRKLKVTRRSLKRANSIKEEYMGHFLDLCSIYMERLDNFNKIVSRKVSTGQIEDLLKMSKSPKFADEQNKLFYENFDSAFLHIYPSFVGDFNSLLLPEEQIEVKEYGKLTMELRIFAFLRMGIEDSNKIASFLHYSVNTIYAYRNKIRNKAKNRETFDEDVMKIGNLD
ncbi:MAG: DUF6377 domain-containing protein [Muribaculaceae bacterium]|nr:DUF6377 domain-containing protein [Muribaculaceae bacterium]